MFSIKGTAILKDLVEEIKEFYRWLVKFITEDIWKLNIDDFGKAKRRAIKYLKVALITIKKSGNDKLGLYAVSLSFFAAMSVVPFYRERSERYIRSDKLSLLCVDRNMDDSQYREEF